MRGLVIAMLALACSVGACALFDEGLPETTCRTAEDCFRAQGEVCNAETHLCELRQDAGIDAVVDAVLDAALDGGVDAP